MRLQPLLLELLAAFCIILCLLLLPFFLVLIAVAVAYRSAIQISTKCIRPDLHKILKPLNHLTSYDNIYENPLFNVAGPIFLEGELSLKELRANIEDNWILKRHPKSGGLVYPELQQSISSFGGYPFWKWDPQFRLQDYVYSPEIGNTKGESWTPEDVNRFISVLMTKPWKRGRALWECLLINNYVDLTQSPQKSSVLILRVHHSLADGFSILNLFKCIMTGSTDATMPVTQGGDNSLMKKVLFPFKAIRDLTLEGAMMTQAQVSTWHRAGRAKKEGFHTVWSKPLSIEGIRRFKNRFDVRFQATVKTIVAGSIRKLLEAAGEAVPDHMYVVVPIPLGNHSEGLQFQFTVASIKLPVGLPSPLHRAKAIQRSLTEVSKSSAPAFWYVVASILGRFPFLEWITKGGAYGPPAVGVSSFPGFQNTVELNGHRALSAGFAVGTQNGSIGATVSALTMNRTITLSLAIDRDIIPFEKVVNTWDAIVKAELDELDHVVDYDLSDFDASNV